jgi:hypothetical protein
MITEKKKALVERVPVDVTSRGLLLEAGVMSASLGGSTRVTNTARRKARKVSRNYRTQGYHSKTQMKTVRAWLGLIQRCRSEPYIRSVGMTVSTLRRAIRYRPFQDPR